MRHSAREQPQKCVTRTHRRGSASGAAQTCRETPLAGTCSQCCCFTRPCQHSHLHQGVCSPQVVHHPHLPSPAQGITDQQHQLPGDHSTHTERDLQVPGAGASPGSAPAHGDGQGSIRDQGHCHRRGSPLPSSCRLCGCCRAWEASLGSGWGAQCCASLSLGKSSSTRCGSPSFTSSAGARA